MDRSERAIREAAVWVAQALGPVVAGLRRVNFFLHSQLSLFGIPLSWHDGVIATIWIVVLFMVFRLVTGWLRLVVVVCTALVVAKMWDFLPPS